VKLDIRQDQQVTVISVEGEVDASTSTDLGDSLDQLLADGHKKLVVDLQNVKFIDSSGLGALVRVYKHARSEASDICLASLQPPVKRVFELTRLDRVFDLHPDLDAAVRRLSGQG
jgi:anti-sigma B factor antagonist